MKIFQDIFIYLCIIGYLQLSKDSCYYQQMATAPEEINLFRKILSRFSSRSGKAATEKKWVKDFKKMNILVKNKALKELEPHLETVYEWLSDEAESEAIHPEWFNQTGLIYQAYSGNFTRAENCFRLALLHADKKGNPREKALAMTNLGVLFLDQNRSAEAVETFQNLKPFIARHFGRESRETATVCQNLASAYRLDGKEDRAKLERIESTRVLRKLA